MTMRYLEKPKNLGIKRVTIKLWSTKDPRRCVFIKATVTDDGCYSESDIICYPKKWRGETIRFYEDVQTFAVTVGLNISSPYEVRWEEIGTW
jgi:hypothetical protein